MEYVLWIYDVFPLIRGSEKIFLLNIELSGSIAIDSMLFLRIFVFVFVKSLII